MQTLDIKDLVQRSLSRPFSIRLTNGAEYSLENRDDPGATKDRHLRFHFGENQAVRIEPAASWTSWRNKTGPIFGEEPSRSGPGVVRRTRRP